MNNNENIIKITNLNPGDIITLNGETITVKRIDAYGANETCITDLNGKVTIMANQNWFDVN